MFLFEIHLDINRLFFFLKSVYATVSRRSDIRAVLHQYFTVGFFSLQRATGRYQVKVRIRTWTNPP